jgi:hypothetical protein
VHVLTGSRLFHLTLTIATQLSGTGGLLVLHNEPGQFEEARRRALSPTGFA